MHIDQTIYRELYISLLNNGDNHIYNDILLPWLARAEKEKIWLAEFSNREGKPYPDATIEDLWRLYALSRISDICLLKFQPFTQVETYDNASWEMDITLSQYSEFFESLGLYIKNYNTFHPFFHEIVKVEETHDVDAPITIVETLWDCMMLGDMMFSRAGVIVQGGKNFINKKVVESSKLYWTYLRRYKPYNDLSHGWGSNSQWRTEFRRDYLTDGYFYYNVDAMNESDFSTGLDLTDENVLQDELDGVPINQLEKIELLRNRCLIHAQVESEYDFYPYNYFFKESI
ncbi:MAG: hypothetical protein Phog2KO_29570 [Phototrophicaceae bacterium]